MVDKDYIKKNLTTEDLSPEQQSLLDFLGMDKYLDMCELFGSTAVFVAKLETHNLHIARRKIVENKELYKHTHITKKQLATMYGISAKTVDTILKEASR